jgi:hypothetical protein
LSRASQDSDIVSLGLWVGGPGNSLIAAEEASLWMQGRLFCYISAGQVRQGPRGTGGSGGGRQESCAAVSL